MAEPFIRFNPMDVLEEAALASVLFIAADDLQNALLFQRPRRIWSSRHLPVGKSLTANRDNASASPESSPASDI